MHKSDQYGKKYPQELDPSVMSTLIFCSYAFRTGLLEEFRDKSYPLKCCKQCLKNCFSGNVEGQSDNEIEIPWGSRGDKDSAEN